MPVPITEYDRTGIATNPLRTQRNADYARNRIDEWYFG
jgi:hypothetical protein